MSSISYILGDWVVEPDLNCIRRDDVERHLEPRSMDILQYLLDHPNESISAERLLNEVWSGRIVEPQAVHRGVNQIRRALDDNPRYPKYIETIRKRGYRVVASVSKRRTDEAADQISRRVVHVNRRSLFGLAVICAMVLVAVAVQWDSDELDLPRPPPPAFHPHAEALYRQARHLMHTGQVREEGSSIELLRRALEIDPHSPTLHLELARAYWQDNSVDPNEYWVRIEKAVSEIEIGLGPASRAYSWRGWIAYARDYNLVSAAQYFTKAVELDPHNIDILRPLVVVLLELGQVSWALDIGRYVSLKDPICAVCLIQHAQAADIAGETEEALDAARRARLLSPDWTVPRQIEALLWIRQGDAKRAIELVEPLPLDDFGRLWIRSIALHDLGDAGFQTELHKLVDSGGADQAARIAHVYAHVGDREEAFARLAEVRSAHDFIVAGFNDHYWASLVDDPRWSEFQVRMGVGVGGLEGERLVYWLSRVNER